MKISLEGRLRNTSLSQKNGLMAVKEAIVNSIQSIAEANRQDGKVSVRILRLQQACLDGIHNNSRRPIDKVIISDNGEGFNRRNFEAFNCLDYSPKQASFGCKGMGRLMWLKAFDSVMIDSAYEENGCLLHRRFSFVPTGDGVNEISIEGDTDEVLSSPGSRVELRGFKADYERASLSDFDEICNDFLAHCIKYFVVENPVEVVIQDHDEKEVSLAKRLIDNTIKKHENKEFTVGKEKFTVTCLLVSSDFLNDSTIFWCANDRVAQVLDKPFSKHQIFDNSIPDGQSLLCVVQSDYLDRNVRSERDDFTIPKSRDIGNRSSQGLDLGPSFDEIVEGVWGVVESAFADLIENARKENRVRIEHAFQQHPQYGPLRKYAADIVIPRKASDSETRKLLRNEYVKIEEKVEAELNRVKNTLDPQNRNYRKRIEKYIQTVLSDKFIIAKQVELASYVARRKAVIDCFEKALELDRNGSYVRESTLHSLIVPMRVCSGNVILDDANLWLIDDRLAFHNYLASDLPLKDYKVVSGLEDDEDRPDLTVFKDYWSTVPVDALDKTTPMVASNGGRGDTGALTIVEFKRPNRTDRECVLQALKYVDRLKGGSGSEIKSFKGRPVKTSNLVQVYVILDISRSFEQELINDDYRKISQGYLYKTFENRGAIVNVCSWDYILNAAKERNKMFFIRLGIEH